MYRDMRPVFKADDEIRCVHCNVIARMDSLRSKYPGGVKAFVEGRAAHCNRHLAVVCSMGPEDLDGVVKELMDFGFVNLEDYICYTDECIRFGFGPAPSYPVDLPVDWLEARELARGGTLFRFVEQSSGRKRKSETDENRDAYRSEKDTAPEEEEFPLSEEEPQEVVKARDALANEQVPPKEECEVLYYGVFFGEDIIIFLQKRLADESAKIHGAMEKARNAGLTWGEVRRKHRKLWRLLLDCELETFEEWLEEIDEKTDKRKQKHLQVVVSPRDEYMKTSKWHRMPLPEEPFDPQVLTELYPFLEAPYGGSDDWIPNEIIDEFGTVEEGFCVAAYVMFQAKDLKEVIRALRKHGYLCRESQRKIDNACGLF
jgi:hypothetical protein